MSPPKASLGSLGWAFQFLEERWASLRLREDRGKAARKMPKLGQKIEPQRGDDGGRVCGEVAGMSSIARSVCGGKVRVATKIITNT